MWRPERELRFSRGRRHIPVPTSLSTAGACWRTQARSTSTQRAATAISTSATTPMERRRRRNDPERFRRDLRLPGRVERLQQRRRDRVRQRRHAGADGHHRNDRHPGRADQHRRGVRPDGDAGVRRRRNVHRRNVHRGERRHARFRRRNVHPFGWNLQCFRDDRRFPAARQPISPGPRSPALARSPSRPARSISGLSDGGFPRADRRHDQRHGHADGIGRGDVRWLQLRCGDRNGDDASPGDDDIFRSLQHSRRRARAGERRHVQRQRNSGYGNFYLGYNPMERRRRRNDPERFRRHVRLPGRVERLQQRRRNGFTNAGTLEQTVTIGTTDIQVALTNTGAVSVQTGTLELDGGGTSAAERSLW